MREPKIIYFCPVVKAAVGGVMVIYRHAQLGREMGFDTYVFHPEKPKWRAGFFEHNAPFLDSLKQIDFEQDIVVLPEFAAVQYLEKYAPKARNWAVLNQSLSSFRVNLLAGTYQQLKEVVSGALLIACVSDAVIASTAYLFPNSKARLFRVLPSLLVERSSHGDVAKKNRISFMPRRNLPHIEHLKFFLEGKLPAGWTLQPIENFSHSDAMEKLKLSKIFMSFSESEGFGLPPLEAAMLGNLVVGYHGQGGREFFEQPIFRQVEPGDYLGYARSVLQAITEIESNELDFSALENQQRILAQRYGLEAEKAALKNFLGSLLNGVAR
jgi:glycosyltransferase involved in cell wall biosynthesis